MQTTLAGWWREPTKAQWLSFAAAWFGWVLDAFDFTVFLLVMPDIAREMGVENLATTGSIALTLFARLLGGFLAGAAADRWGRKLPLMISIVWFALCDGAVSIAPSFTWIVILRTLFGFGMGAEWASGTTLAMVNWPARSRGIASGILQGSWAIGYFLAAAASAWVVPVFGWRAMFVIAAVPALLVLPIRIWVPESAGWKEACAGLERALHKSRPRDLTGRIVWGSLLMAAGFGAYYGLTGLYPTLLRSDLGLDGDAVARLVMLFNGGMLVGSALSGILAARRGVTLAIAVPALASLPFLPLYVGAHPALLGVGAVFGGLFGAGFCGTVPLLLTDLFPPEARARSIGIVYHVGSAAAALVPTLEAALARYAGMPLGRSVLVVTAFFETLVAVLMIARALRPVAFHAEVRS